MDQRDEAMTHSILILDDDPAHLRIYGWIVEAAGYRPLPRLVSATGIELGTERPSLVLLDYHLAGNMTARDAATRIRAEMPGVPIFVLSDLLMMPDDVRPLVDGFVRKGDPGKLVHVLKETLGG
jgi:CheY-like chemotaxis protein